MVGHTAHLVGHEKLHDALSIRISHYTDNYVSFRNRFLSNHIIIIYFSDGWPRGPTTLESGWPFGNFVRKMANGHAIVIFKSVCSCNASAYLLCTGLLLTLWPLGINFVFPTDPKSDEVYYPMLPWLGRGLLTANGPRWARSRRLLTPAFHYEILRPYVRVYGEAVSELVKLWAELPEGESFDVFPYISNLTLDVMLRCACSYRSDCQNTK